MYRLFLALMEGTWPQRVSNWRGRRASMAGLILMADGLQPDGESPQPVSAVGSAERAPRQWAAYGPGRYAPRDGLVGRLSCFDQ